MGYNLTSSDGESFSDNEDWKDYFIEPAKQDNLFDGLSNSSKRSNSKKGDSQLPKAWKSCHLWMKTCGLMYTIKKLIWILKGKVYVPQ